ncbi:TniB family NTP-binding protein [Actinomadura opuntiae]|uniref:TniB family NTP-binding protein n=1 Tax=Actinomadura sp. OS1-43 TaxID=604315 RepID=UPI00255AACBA|nr:TniB family NTP-binding protein [Actinomadura sp. OS1-43]MDL4813149.1 AAA family ATPase [Actinomadura sp. OS1-43]
MLANAHQPAGARRGVVIDGPPTVGKSTLVKLFAADLEKTLRRREPHKFQPHENDGYIVDYTPVVYISIPSQATPKDLSAAFAEWFNLPLRRAATKNEMTDAVLRATGLCGVQLIIIDDVHFLDLSAKEGKVVNDHLKYLANHCAATFVFTGHDLETSGLFLEGGASERATQTSGRNSLHKLGLFTIGTDDERRAWANVVKTMEDALVLLDHKPGTLIRDHEYLHHRTGGSIASLSLLIREAAIRAVVSSEEAITRKVLDQVVIDRRATRGYDKFRKQHNIHHNGNPGRQEPPAEAS